MPIYEYQCKACGHRFDALQKVSDEPLSACPECTQAELKKLVSAPNFRLKGSGWYETDFKKDKQRNLVDGQARSDKSSGKDTKSETKPAPDKKDKPAAAEKKKKKGKDDRAA